jgi:hypothetical protein
MTEFVFGIIQFATKKKSNMEGYELNRAKT